MCGIAGILRWGEKGISREEIERMSGAIRHRGPDRISSLVTPPIAIANTRLAIIDIEHGDQPMSTAGGSLSITYNGEVYNFVELRRQLDQLGHQFTTHSDTEVVLRAYEEWGSASLARLRGMFAFAIVDFKRRILFLARDPFGIKPLLIRTGRGFLAFASEINALLAIDEPRPVGNLSAVDHYLRFRYIPGPASIYRDTLKVPPASFVEIGFDGEMSPFRRYCDLTLEHSESQSEAASIDSAREVIRDSVKAHLTADVPVGVYLSGGIDSTVVGSYVAELAPHSSAFFLGFDESEDKKDLEHAKRAAATLGLDLKYELLPQQSVDILPDLVRACGEPLGDSSLVPTWYLSRLARNDVKVVLSGDGGDELFGGYDSYAAWLTRNRITTLGRALVNDPVGSVRRFLSPRLARSAGRLAAWQASITFLHERSRLALWRREHRAQAFAPSPLFDEASATAAALDDLSFVQYLDYRTYLPFDILTKVDLASMQHGLEARTPLLDRFVAEFASRLPRSLKHGADDAQPTPKYLLKRLLEPVFPREFVHRPKRGFDFRRKELFLPGGRFHDRLESLIFDGKALARFFEPRVAHAHLEVHRRVEDNSGVLWMLLVLGLWLEQNPQTDFE